ncbi:MAG: decarboxylating 6-phosphogluconate dehydrogenase [Chlorobiaceae bacterium]|nr:decarboxylating 6-phosphogluconate dehydrogenase [Chlorobiaceae bacterium]
MKVGVIGLGKMGSNMVRHLLQCSHEAVVYDLADIAVAALAEEGAQAARSVEALAGMLNSPRIIWLMVPAGAPVDVTLERLMPLLEDGDIVVDGGNSHYVDSVHRAKRLGDLGIHFLDAGTSGGLEGALYGACIMVGGDRAAYAVLEPLLKDLSVENGYGYMGSSGSGHFAKMVHNGIEYGMMQAMGEGFDLLASSGYDYNLHEVSKVWANGSVIRGWLMDLVVSAFQKDLNLASVSGRIADSGEGRWTVEAALEHEVSIPVIAASLFSRFRSRSDENLSDRVVAALRHEFGGHGVNRKP